MNAYALVANQLSSAALGFMYWLLAARLYGVEVVGSSSAAISTLLLISALAQLGLGAGMNRFLPRAGRHARRLILSSYAAIVLAAMAAAAAFLWLDRVLGFSEEIMAGTGPASVVVAAVLWSVFYFQDSVLIGLRRSVWVFVENQLYNLLKIALLVLGVSVLGRYGIVGSWFLPTPLIIALVTWLVFVRFIRVDRVSAEPTAGDTLTAREIVMSVTGDHFGTLVAETSVRVLPVIVVSMLGAAANAYFYQAWMIATMLQLIASGMGNSFTAEAAGDRGNIGFYSRGILRQMMILLTPVALLIGLGAPIVLSLFGSGYAAAGSVLLRLLAVAVPLVVFNTWYLNYSRVMGHIRRVVSLQFLTAVLLIALSYPGLRLFGIAGVGLAWIVGQGTVTLIVARDAWRVLSPAGNTPETSLGRTLRRADWRFLLPDAGLHRAVSFVGEGALRRSAEAVAEEVVDAGSPSAIGCDVAVLADPRPDELRAALLSLRPDGACCSEWTAWDCGGVRGVRRRLERAGFTDIHVHWPAPDAESVRIWAELSPADARVRTITRRVIADSARGGAARAASVAAYDIAVATGLAPALVATGRRPGGGVAPRRSFTGSLADRIAEAEGVEADRMTLVMRTGGSDLGSKVNWLVFLDDDPKPRWVAKAARHEVAIAALRREQAALAGLAASGARGVIGPRLVHWSEHDSTAVLVQSAIHGTPLAEAAARVPYDVLARRLTTDLAVFAGRRHSTPRGGWWDLLVGQLLERLADHLDVFGDPATAPAVRAALERMGPVPLVWTHGDCAPWNAFLRDDGMALFDWEDGHPKGLPLTDLVYCLATIAFLQDGTANTPLAVRTYRRLLDPADARGSVFMRCLDEYADAVGVERRDIPALRTATWLVHATQDLSNILWDNVAISSRLLERSTCLPLLRAEAEAAGTLGEAPEGMAAPASVRDVSLGSAVFISPHLDDAVLSCGSAIKRLTASGAQVTVVNCCTEDLPLGRPLSRLARCSHHSWALAERPFAARRKEDAEALRLLGAEWVDLGLHDAMYRIEHPTGRPLYGRAPIVAKVHREDVERFLPDLRERISEVLDAQPRARVFCPAGVGGHADHLLVRRAVEELCDPSRIVYYEEYPYSSRPGALRLVPRGDGSRWISQTLSPTADELDCRIEAIACYRSQLRGLFPSLVERLRCVAATWIMPLRHLLLGEIDVGASTERMRRHVRRDLTATGGERYWWAVGSASPFE